VFRDAQQFTAPLALLEAVGLGIAVTALLSARRLEQQGAFAYAGTAMLLPLVALPQLGWGLGATLRPVWYPGEWADVRAIVDADPRPGAIVVLPWSTYRVFDWNAGVVVLDPAVKAFSRRVVASDSVVVGGTAIAGEDALARHIGTILTVEGGTPSAQELGMFGIRYVLCESASPAAPAGAVKVFSGPSLTLYRVPEH
jgi:hypothetical protein